MNKYTTCLRGRVQYMTDRQLLFVFKFIQKAIRDRGLDTGSDSAIL